ncbi:hypothetical protein M8C21_020971 [Ambrosia artemisiifolia]|uniref:Uncharacterized protein n=1 Tax=Ambrosia artemisiifolia TaxID=4212 RepID=A0AAD5GJL8_AMBAR|nr:hypothetical protein M8C21_020971 [Ambrosia artemisiifolia]
MINNHATTAQSPSLKTFFITPEGRHKHHQDKFHLRGHNWPVVVSEGVGDVYLPEDHGLKVVQDSSLDFRFLEVNLDGKVPLIKLDENECLFLYVILGVNDFPKFVAFLKSKDENGASEQGLLDELNTSNAM